MSLRVYRISDYDHQADQRQFDHLASLLSPCFSQTGIEALLIGRYEINEVVIDALLITPTAILVFGFKDCGGSISIDANGNWTADAMIIDGGASARNPLVQMRNGCSSTAQGLARYLHRPLLNVQGILLFSHPIRLNQDTLAKEVSQWLHLCDKNSVIQYIKVLSTKTENPGMFSAADLQTLPSILNITAFHQTEAALPHTSFSEGSLYAPLRAALSLPIRAAYREFSLTLRLAVDQKTQFNTLRLGGLYAKLDYLAREYQVARDISRSINDTRIRLRRIKELRDADLKDYLYQDLKAICRFLNAVYGEPIPEDLALLFPAEERRAYTGQLVSKSLRLYVTSWDENYLYGHSEDLPDTDIIKVCYNFTSEFAKGNWAYLKGYFLRDCQVNLVRPRLREGIYYPELIILDPDLLIDITSITQCYEEYAHTPLLHLVKKIAPFENSEAIILGNFASQLLDEEVHCDTIKTSYGQSYEKFLRANTFSVLTTKIPNLRANGEEQQRNIQRALNEGLVAKVGQFKRSEIILEPSFFSEMLGLQGRMDMLSLDYHVLLEQKSGKSAFVPGAPNNSKPLQQPKHYMQLLLYLAILHYNYGMDNHDISAFLLYSKYPQGLIGLSSAPELLFEAIKIRNGIAWLENLLCRGGINILDKLAPPSFRQLKVKDDFWTKYYLPPLEKVFVPLRNASPLERAYFYRFMTFVENEYMLAKVGNKTKENSGFAAKWHDTLEEKLEAGNIYDELSLVDPAPDHTGSVETLTFRFAKEQSIDMSNFRKGDIVIVYPYPRDAEPDARRTMVFRCTLTRLTSDTIEMELRAPQSDQRVFRYNADCLWAVEHDFFDSSSSALYRGLHSLLSASKERRDLLLMQREPQADTSVALRGNYDGFNDLALRVRQAQDLFLIIGPPGTGKTSYGMLYTLEEQLQTPGSSVLVMSYTNRAVDEICSKLEERHIDYLRLGNPHSCEPAYRSHLLDNQVSELTLDEMEQLLQQTRVIVGTTSTLNGSLALFAQKRFDLAIVDEASQILEPQLVGLFSAKFQTESAIRKFVLIGDEKQLPAVVQQSTALSRVIDPELNAIGLTDCRLSLFERFLHRYRNNPSIVYLLHKQGRMHRDIAEFPNLAFYHGKLEVVPLSHQENLLPITATCSNGIDAILQTKRLAFIASPLSHPEEEQETNTATVHPDKVNPVEAKMIAATILRIYLKEKENFDVQKTLGVIVPYRNQIATIRNEVDSFGIPDLHDITIDTVERYQGSQRDYIIYGFTIQRRYQLDFLTNNDYEDEGCIIDRKLNVAMTRARLHLLMFGNPELLSEDPVFSSLLSFIRSRNGYFAPDPDIYIRGAFTI